jgi:hypothetical protein
LWWLRGKTAMLLSRKRRCYAANGYAVVFALEPDSFVPRRLEAANLPDDKMTI